MSTSAHLLAAIFPNREHAQVILDMLEKMNHAYTIRLVDAALVTKNYEGKLEIHETKELTAKKGARRGAVIMGSFAILFPPTIIASAIVGGAIGAVAGRLHDSGLKSKQLHKLAEDLEPGQAIVIVLAEDGSEARVQSALEGYDGKVVIAAIDEQTLNDLHKAAAMNKGSDE